MARLRIVSSKAGERMNDQSTGRRGGREARRAMRAAPLTEDTRPVRPGMEGGRYKPLDDVVIESVEIVQA